MKTCVGCKYYMKPTYPTFKEAVPMLLFPVIGWIILLVLYSLPSTAWCSVGDAMAGEDARDGWKCSKMRTVGCCGPDAKLFEKEV